MNVTLTYTGYLNLPDIKSGDSVVLPDDATVVVLMDHCGIRKEHQRFIRLMINGDTARATRELCDGDEIHFILPVGGGRS